MMMRNSLVAVHTLAVVEASIRCIVTSADEQHLFVGLHNGKIHIYALDADYLRERTLKIIANLGF